MTKPVFQQIDKLPNLTYPALKWRWEFWLTVIPFVLGFIVFFAPNIAQENTILKIALGGILCSTPILIPLLLWLISSIRIAIKRAQYYPHLHDRFQIEQSNLESLRKEYIRLLQNSRESKSLELSKASYTKGQLYIRHYRQ